MKKIITLLMSMLLVFSLAACSNNNSNSANNEAPVETKTALEKVQEAGKLVVATEGTWAPYTYVDENDYLTGYDVEVARAVAEKLGVEAEFSTGDFDGFLIGLDNGIYDAVFNCIDVTEERSAKYDFSDPYINSTVVLIVAADNEEITSFDDLADKVTTNTINSSYAGAAEEYGATVSPATTFEETIDLVLQGRADATLNSQASYNDYMALHPDAALKVVDSFVSYAAVPLKKGDTSLRDAINVALTELKAEGKLQEISIKFFDEDVTGE